MSVSLEEVRFTHRACSDHFKKGPAGDVHVDDRVEDLRSAKYIPLQEEFLCLNVIEANLGLADQSSQCVYYSLDNRRLWCMKQAFGPERRIKVRI